MSLAVIRVVCYHCGNADRCLSLQERLGLPETASRQEIAAGLEQSTLFHTCSFCQTNFRIIGADLNPPYSSGDSI